MMKEKINFFEPEETPARIHIGLRTIKTVIAVFLCSIIGFLRGQPTVFSMIAAVACMQNTTGKTLETSFNQVLGTAIGAAFGLGALFLEQVFNLRDLMLLYYFICALSLIPIIIFTLIIKKPSISSFACIVFLGVAVYQLDTEQPGAYALQRTADIFLGVVMAFIVNIVLPNRSARFAASGNDGPEQKNMPGDIMDDSDDDSSVIEFPVKEDEMPEEGDERPGGIDSFEITEEASEAEDIDR